MVHEQLWWAWQDEVETECSGWYRNHVEPVHEHVWTRCTHCRRIGFLGLGGFGCIVGGPITGLSTRVQMEIYKHFKDPLEGKRLFIRLEQWDAESPRMWEALMEWVDKDYPGSWRDWWEKHRDAPSQEET